MDKCNKKISDKPGEEALNPPVDQDIKLAILKDYKYTKLLGKGSFGTVYLIQFVPKINRDISRYNSYEQIEKPFYAVKVINLENDENRKNFQKENNIIELFSKVGKTVKCIHSNISCHLYADVKDSCGYILTEYFETDLAKDLLTEHSFSVRTKLDNRTNYNRFISWSKQLFEGISYLHSLGLAHTDLKPENILIRYTDNRLAITDFDGLCIGFKGSCFIDIISYYFASPELYKNLGKKVDLVTAQVSDIWAAALCILSMWFGQNLALQVLQGFRSINHISQFYNELNVLSFQGLLKLINNELQDYREYFTTTVDKTELENQIFNLSRMLVGSVAVLYAIVVDKTPIKDINDYKDIFLKL